VDVDPGVVGLQALGGMAWLAKNSSARSTKAVTAPELPAFITR
jgi:hypothetical protein